jgi:two-component system KDP operon response regulator KdpE
MKIIVIEDDKNIASMITLTLRIRWPEAEIENSYLGRDGISAIETQNPDLVILDLGLPDMNGFDVIREIRQFSNVSIIILTVHREDDDIIAGLELGADDYIIKPFKQLEFLSRIKAVMRRREINAIEVDIKQGKYKLDSQKRIFFVDDKVITLTHIENIIMRLILQAQGKIVTNSALTNALWGYDYPGSLESLRVCIYRLRNKIEKDPKNPAIIKTRTGYGYFLGDD